MPVRISPFWRNRPLFIRESEPLDKVTDEVVAFTDVSSCLICLVLPSMFESNPAHCLAPAKDPLGIQILKNGELLTAASKSVTAKSH